MPHIDKLCILHCSYHIVRTRVLAHHTLSITCSHYSLSITHCASDIEPITSCITQSNICVSSHIEHRTLSVTHRESHTSRIPPWHIVRHTSHIGHHTMCLVQNSIILFITLGFNPFHCRLFGLPFLLRFLFKSTACPLFFGSLPLLWNWHEELKSNGHSGFFQHSKLRTFVRLKSSLATQDKMRKKENEKENHWWCLSSHF